jgi:CRP-like cAMP-binding protein
MAVVLLESLSARLRRLMHYAETLAFFDVHSRVRHVLLDLAQQYGRAETGGVLINVDVTQGELATMVGATRERVNRALASLRAQGLIDTRDKRMLIRDPARLSEGIS